MLQNAIFFWAHFYKSDQERQRWMHVEVKETSIADLQMLRLVWYISN